VLLLAALSLFLLYVYSLSGGAAPQTEEVPEAEADTADTDAKGFATPQAIPAMTLVTAVSAARAQATSQEASIVQALIVALRDTSATLRADAARALGNRTPPATAAVPALITALGDADRRVRERAAAALGDIGDDAAVPALGQALTADTNRDVAEEAARALGQIATPEAATRLEGALLSASLRDEPFRRVVVESLGRTGQPSAVEMLVGFLPVADRRLQMTIMEALADSESPAAIAALLRMLQGTDPALRLLAVRALGGG
jgi:HEAT repeat protein